MNAEIAYMHAGGPRMVVMTGAKVGLHNGALEIRFPSGKARRVRVTLNAGTDLYTVETFKSAQTLVASTRLEGIDCEALKPTLERVTGLYFSL